MKDFKVRCILSGGNFTVGKIYEVKNGVIYEDDGDYEDDINSVEYLNQRYGSQFELVTEPQFTKDMLRTGMRVEIRTGERYVVLKDLDMASNGIHWLNLGYLTTDLINYEGKSEFDIMKVYNAGTNNAIVDVENLGILLWQRPEPRKIKKSEAEKLLSEHLEELIQIEG